MDGVGQRLQEAASNGSQSQEHRLPHQQLAQTDRKSLGGQAFGTTAHGVGQSVADALSTQASSQDGNDGLSMPAPSTFPPASATPRTSSDHPLAAPERHALRSLPEGSASFQDHAARSDANQEPVIVVVGDRRVRLSSESDPSSLYSLCRRWVRNRPGEDEELGFAPLIPSVLPKPLPAESVRPETNAEGAQEQGGGTAETIKPGRLSPRDLLKAHVRGFREVRKRKRENWQQRVKRYKSRLCLIFPPGAAAVAELKDVNRGAAKH